MKGSGVPATHLAIAGLPTEFVEMRSGGLYWVVAAGSAPTDLLGAGVLATADALDEAVLVTLGRGAESMLALLPADQGRPACGCSNARTMACSRRCAG